MSSLHLFIFHFLCDTDFPMFGALMYFFFYFYCRLHDVCLQAVIATVT